MTKILKLTPFFSERLWGCQKLRDLGFDIPRDKKIGEAWVISALENGMSFVKEGDYANLSLKELYEKHNQDIFKDNGDHFPLLTKIITAADYLSVQVHPDDEYALKNEHCYGKPECWFVLDAPADGELIYGHNAKSRDELKTMVENHEWKRLFKTIKVQAGDFVYVPPGKVHAIGPGVTVVEVQRSSDITYRFYDFDRKDKDGNLRPLHIEQCLDTTAIPDQDLPIKHLGHGTLVDTDFFTVILTSATVDSKIKLPNVHWCQVNAIAGSGKIEGYPVEKGEAFILYDINSSLDIVGDVKLLISYKK